MIEIPARQGKALHLRRGQKARVINTKGQQVVDTWAFNAADLTEFMSMEHSRVAIGRIIPGVGDALVTNKRRPILSLIEDTSGGIHDMLLARARHDVRARLPVRRDRGAPVAPLQHVPALKCAGSGKKRAAAERILGGQVVLDGHAVGLERQIGEGEQ